MVGPHAHAKSTRQRILSFFWIALGAFLAALSIRVFLVPNNLIDGGIIGISLIFGRAFGDWLISPVLVVLTLPFLYLAYKHIRKAFLVNFAFAVFVFALLLSLLEFLPPFIGDALEVVVVGGAVLGAGAGLIIRNGGCLDGTEILAIIINRKKGFTVGQVVLFINIFIFGAYGYIFKDWHIALRSILTYIVAFKMMDIVITGLDELKSVLIISAKPKQLKEVIMHEMGLGLTIMYGRGGYTGDAREILFVIVERLDFAELKEIILREDPEAFMAIENLYEVVYGKSPKKLSKRKKKKKRVKRLSIN